MAELPLKRAGSVFYLHKKGINMVNDKISPHDIINGVGAGLCLLDRNFRIMWINRHQADWFGDPQVLCGKHCYAAFEQRKHVCRGCPAAKVFKTGKVHTARRIGVTKTGKKQYFQLTVSPIKDKDGRVDFALELVQNITDKVINDRHNSVIAHRLKNMCAHLSVVNKKLRHNIHRLKAIAARMSVFSSSINKKYHRKVSELLGLQEELKDIFKVNHVLISAVSPEKILSLITRLSCELTHADACILRILDNSGKALSIASSYGIHNELKRNVQSVNVNEGISGRAFNSGKPTIVHDVAINGKLEHKFKEVFNREGVRSAVAVPISFQGKAMGAISVFSRNAQHFSREKIKCLSVFALQVAIAIQESRHYEDIHKNYFDTVHALVLAEEARDPYTRGHTDRVTKYAMALGKMLRLSHEELETLRYAGEVHDIGKIGIPDFILGKPGRLTPAERAMIELHPVKGAEMLEPLEFLKPALPIVRHHHERFDGTGYPDGLEKEKIPIMARVLACADSFDAMTSDRPYRNRKLSTEEALAEIKNNSGSQFDPKISRSFIKLIRSQDK